ncbi:MAG TPA: c-type cytochrome [Gemmatimonadaceae bacterium]|nr:c-type cytochrome [Gemmatimonadaceae bacterium]
MARGARGDSLSARIAGAVLVTCALVLSGCHDGDLPRAVPGGNPDAGKQAIHAYGCGACHTVPGVRGANGLVGPPLTHFARRSFIAGEASNTADNLIRWIQAPESIEPGTAMPNLGVTEQMARDMAAYLYTLR